MAKVPTRFDPSDIGLLIEDIFGELIDTTMRAEQAGYLSEMQTSYLLADVYRLSKDYEFEIEKGKKDERSV